MIISIMPFFTIRCWNHNGRMWDTIKMLSGQLLMTLQVIHTQQQLIRIRINIVKFIITKNFSCWANCYRTNPILRHRRELVGPHPDRWWEHRQGGQL